MSDSSSPNIRVHGSIDRCVSLAVQQLWRDEIIRSAEVWESVGSTNTQAVDELSGGISQDALPKLFLAEHQTAGRGRHGRQWKSSHRNLAFSLLIDWEIEPVEQLQRLSIAVGVAIARALEYACAPVRCRLKWPNDVHVDAGKVAGILIESRPPSRGLVIGIGINVFDAPTIGELIEIDENRNAIEPKSISESAGRVIDKGELLSVVVTQVLDAILDLQGDSSELLEDFRSRCVLTGQRVSLASGERSIVGACEGITNDGRLVVLTEDGRQTFSTGEARAIRPA